VKPVQVEDYRRIVFLTGAGISAASGLPTYRGAGGLWTTHNVAAYATAEAVQADPRRVWEFFASVRTLIAAASPNGAHVAIAQWEQRVRSDQSLTVLTQNVDGLHQLAGSKTVIELHGSLRRSRCTRCDYARVEDLSASPEEGPDCPRCSACLRPAVVLFEEFLDVEVERSAKHALRDCDLFIAVGTSGTVSPASNFARAARFEGARTIYVNLEPMVPANPAFAEVVLGPAEVVLPELLGVATT
jgi:NAD-dependent deacetylase